MGVVAGSILWSAIAVATLVAFVFGMVALLLSNKLGDRIQSILLWLGLLLVGLIWLVSSVAFVTRDVSGWWWAGIATSGGVVGIALAALRRISQRRSSVG